MLKPQRAAQVATISAAEIQTWSEPDNDAVLSAWLAARGWQGWILNLQRYANTGVGVETEQGLTGDHGREKLCVLARYSHKALFSCLLVSSPISTSPVSRTNTLSGFATPLVGQVLG